MGVPIYLKSSLIEKLADSFSLCTTTFVSFALDFLIGIFKFGKAKPASGLGIFFHSL